MKRLADVKRPKKAASLSSLYNAWKAAHPDKPMEDFVVECEQRGFKIRPERKVLDKHDLRISDYR